MTTTSEAITIDLNSDLGEHPKSNLDTEIMPYLSSCNIACGGHIGDKNSVIEAIKLAKANQVVIGAHPSYPDQENFGRILMEIDPDLLKDSITQQIKLVKLTASEFGVALHHVKPHGALYNHAANHAATSELIGGVIQSIDPKIKWMGLAHSEMQKVAANRKIPFISEAFADRRYEANKTLRSRKLPGAVITNEREVLNQVEELVLRKRVISEGWVDIRAQSICLHGDTMGAVSLAKKIHEHLVSNGVTIDSA